MTFNRRQIMTGAAGLIGTAALGGISMPRRAFAQSAIPTYTPESGATLRLLRWVPFVKAEEEAWNANTRAFTDTVFQTFLPHVADVEANGQNFWRRRVTRASSAACCLRPCCDASQQPATVAGTSSPSRRARSSCSSWWRTTVRPY